MKIKYVLLLTTFFVSFFGFSQESTETKKENPFSIKWDNGFKVESLDKNFKLKFGGRVMIDHAYFFQNTDMDENFGELEVPAEPKLDVLVFIWEEPFIKM